MCIGSMSVSSEVSEEPNEYQITVLCHQSQHDHITRRYQWRPRRGLRHHRPGLVAVPFCRRPGMFLASTTSIFTCYLTLPKHDVNMCKGTLPINNLSTTVISLARFILYFRFITTLALDMLQTNASLVFVGISPTLAV